MSSDKPCCKGKHKTRVRASELPLYGNPNPPKDIIKTDESGALENGIRKARGMLQKYFDSFSGAKKRTQQVLTTAYDHGKSTYYYISDEANTVPKAVAITSGGLLGTLLSSRRGIFKKVSYTSLGIAIAAAACYPKQAQEIGQLTVYIVKTYGPPLIKDYTGIDVNSGISGVFGKKKDKDINQIAEDSANVQQFGFRLEENKVPEPSLTTTKELEAVDKSKTGVKGDFGQSNIADRDLYANRSTK